MAKTKNIDLLPRQRLLEERKGIFHGNFHRERSGCNPRGHEELQRKNGLNANEEDLVLNQINKELFNL